ncbi:hypothetical protein [Aquimarina brevivitae]|uniref:LTXXQ motif family protein n=1 Tax=Aquimarina brevivitae TaxID=323412 RepID=A0A4Q7PJ39_9FLAO|nr:hypothetical protein [Aquimarina brevivitae]RZT00059.1 hypothetical protein EV197_1289 [Aquimarina brevivitae]
MKYYIVLLFLITSMTSFGQNTIYQDSDPKLAKEAKDLAYKYDKQLGLTEKQLLTMEKKIEEYLIKEKKIRNSNLSIENKILAIKQNWADESADMSDLLTRPQLQLYEQLKTEYQPIEPVVVKDADDDDDDNWKDDQ